MRHDIYYISTMKHVSILALYDATIASIDSSQQMLNRVNDFLKYKHMPPFYVIDIVGAERNIDMNKGLYRVQPTKLLKEVGTTDMIIIPMLCGNFPEAIKANKPYIDWICDRYQQGAEIACLCVGSFILGATGLLDGKRCAIHWAAKDEFMRTFPAVLPVDDKIITDEARMYTCGGGYAYLNLLLYVIERQVGKEISILASKMFEIDTDRKSQYPFAIFIGQKAHNDREVLQAQKLIEDQPCAAYSVDGICASVGVGRRSFERRFKKSTGNTIAEYVQRVKVEFAKKQLELSDKTINEIIYEVGYNDSDTFRKIFRRYADMSPGDYRRRFG
jgi:transcriptional regulator GlxA family with amidase domain